MKYCIAVINGKKTVGYWFHSGDSQYVTREIRTDTIQLYKSLEDVEKEFKVASSVIVKKYGSDHVPGIMLVSVHSDAESFYQSIDRHLEYCKSHWMGINPTLIKEIEIAVDKIKH